MSIYSCNSCGACGGQCDQCTLAVCLNNMGCHREIYKLKDDFEQKVCEATQNLYDKCIEIKHNLSNNYGINIEIASIYDKILQSKDFLNKMKIKKEETNNYNNKTKTEMEIIKKEKLDKINQLNNIHLQKKEEIKKKFENEEKKYKINESKHDEEIKSKKQIINDLVKEKDNIFIDIDEIVKDFITEERKKVEKEFDISKNEVDARYIYQEKELKYSPKELKQKDECLNEIKKIKSYSDKIPNFDKWIIAFNLNKYFN